MIIDTNVLIYEAFEDLDKHEEARRMLDSLPEWFIPSVVLIEFIAFLNKSGLEREKNSEKVRGIDKKPKSYLS